MPPVKREPGSSPSKINESEARRLKKQETRLLRQSANASRRPPTNAPSPRYPYPHSKPARHRPPKYVRKFPIVEATLVEHTGKFYHLNTRVSMCEEAVETLAQLNEQQAMATGQIVYLVQESQKQGQNAELQGQVASLETSLLNLTRKVESLAQQKQPLPQYPGQNAPLSPPLTPILSPMQLSARSVPEEVYPLHLDDDWFMSWPASVEQPIQNVDTDGFGNIMPGMPWSPLLLDDRVEDRMEMPDINYFAASSPSPHLHNEPAPGPLPGIEGEEANIDMEMSAIAMASVRVTPAKTPRQDNSEDEESDDESWLDINTLTVADTKESPAETEDLERPSYDRKFTRQRVLHLRRATAPSPPQSPAPVPELPSANTTGDTFSKTMLFSPGIHLAEYSEDTISKLFSCPSSDIEDPSDTEATATRILDEATGMIDITPLRPQRPMSRAELRFKATGQVKDLHYAVWKRLNESGCDELWNGGDAVVKWDGASRVDERTKELAVDKLGWAKEVAADSD